MANTLCFNPINSFTSPNKPGVLTSTNNAPKLIRLNNDVFQTSRNVELLSVVVKAGESNPTTKVHSILCGNCDGNGAVVCSQCQGTGVNTVDHFNGQFKAGGSCWLCRGKKEMLCGDCNGAGFRGGFMSTQDE